MFKKIVFFFVICHFLNTKFNRNFKYLYSSALRVLTKKHARNLTISVISGGSSSCHTLYTRHVFPLQFTRTTAARAINQKSSNVQTVATTYLRSLKYQRLLVVTYDSRVMTHTDDHNIQYTTSSWNKVLHDGQDTFIPSKMYIFLFRQNPFPPNRFLYHCRTGVGPTCGSRHIH